MSNLFEGRKIYGEKWNVKEERDFSAEELNMVDRAQVVDSDYGLSCCFTMKSGGVLTSLWLRVRMSMLATWLT